ncbi:MAG: type III-B CRISPR module RAMP protein Cmr4 [Chloroflexi bacterium]|nr:type III-B CRISPR module RAMP protein Cmr4 [Chloroflexota bacterium]
MTIPSHQTTATGRAAGAAPVVLALYTETPLHPGTGQSTGIVDLPVQRERHTDFPIIPSTSLKGSLRRLAEGRWSGRDGLVDLLFGPRPQAGGGSDLHAGALAFSDARLLAFPVRSLTDVFLWVTCPLALGRLARDLRLAAAAAPDLSSPDQLQPAPGRLIAADERSGTVVLEDLSFQVDRDGAWSDLAAWLAELLPAGEAHRTYREKFARHVALISDGDFAYLVKHATQVTARVALNEHKTTTGGGGNLWYEETVPADSLFTTLVLPEEPRTPLERRQRAGTPSAEAVRDQFLELVHGDPFFVQVGGNETVGHGWCAVRVLEQGGGALG